MICYFRLFYKLSVNFFKWSNHFSSESFFFFGIIGIFKLSFEFIELFKVVRITLVEVRESLLHEVFGMLQELSFLDSSLSNEHLSFVVFGQTRVSFGGMPTEGAVLREDPRAVRAFKLGSCGINQRLRSSLWDLLSLERWIQDLGRLLRLLDLSDLVFFSRNLIFQLNFRNLKTSVHGPVFNIFWPFLFLLGMI